MISQVHGTLIEATPSTAVIEAAGVGFELGISGMTAAELPELGGEVRLYTRMQVREDAIALYGFATKDERAVFDRLIAVSGVGPRLALSVLSKFTVSQLYSTVMAEDEEGMTAVPGVGKKTAQRLILELKGVFEKDSSLAGVQLTGPERIPSGGVVKSSTTTAMDDASAALLSMGFTPQETELALAGADDEGKGVEEILVYALRRLGADA